MLRLTLVAFMFGMLFFSMQLHAEPIWYLNLQPKSYEKIGYGEGASIAEASILINKFL